MTLDRPALPLPNHASGSRSIAWWGMLLLIANEAVLFASLIAAYLYTRFNSPVWPPAPLKRPELLLPLIGTVVLVSSSLVMQRAQAGIRQRNLRHLRIGFAVALVLAIVFLGIQLFEYSRMEFLPTDNTYGSLFFTITGIHGLHVLMAILINAAVLLKTYISPPTTKQSVAVENAVLYWHFVDVVWLFIVATLYLSPYL